MIKQFILALAIIGILVFPVGAYDIASNSTGSTTAQDMTSATFTDVTGANISVASTSGARTTVMISLDMKTNYSLIGYVQGRFLRDGVEIQRKNLTSSTYPITITDSVTIAESSTDTHYYAYQISVASSTRKVTIHKYNMTVSTINPGSFSDYLLIATYAGDFPNSTLGDYLLTATYAGNFPNSTVASNLATWNGYGALITGLQGNDTTDRAYVNNTFLPITTYSGDFPNSTLGNYLPISTYSGDFPNASVAANLAAWNATYNASYENRSITLIISNGSNVIGTGIKGDIRVPFNGTIIEATGLADQSGSCNVSYWKDTYANFPPTAADVVGYVNITAAATQQNTGLSYLVTKGDIIRFNVDSCTTITRETVSLTVRTEV